MTIWSSWHLETEVISRPFPSELFGHILIPSIPRVTQFFCQHWFLCQQTGVVSLGNVTLGVRGVYTLGDFSCWNLLFTWYFSNRVKSFTLWAPDMSGMLCLNIWVVCCYADWTEQGSTCPRDYGNCWPSHDQGSCLCMSKHSQLTEATLLYWQFFRGRALTFRTT